jgi:hypothetical protein
MPPPMKIHAARYQTKFCAAPSSTKPLAIRTAPNARTNRPPCSPIARPSRGEIMPATSSPTDTPESWCLRCSHGSCQQTEPSCERAEESNRQLNPLGVIGPGDVRRTAAEVCCLFSFASARARLKSRCSAGLSLLGDHTALNCSTASLPAIGRNTTCRNDVLVVARS